MEMDLKTEIGDADTDADAFLDGGGVGDGRRTSMKFYLAQNLAPLII